MKRLLLFIWCLAAAAAGARSVSPGRLPRGEYADTEATTNVPFAFGPQGAKRFQFELGLAGTPSNNVQLAFGRDADLDGALSACETDMAFAWDCGEWRIVDGATGEALSSAAATTNGVKRLSWELILRRGSPSRLAVTENGVALFSDLADSPMPWVHSMDWDILRLTVRGADAPSEDVRVGVEISGFSLKLR